MTEPMTIEEIEAAMQSLRERRKALKSGGKAAQRKIDTLCRRRERLMAKVTALDEQMIALRSETPVTPAPKRRGRPAKNTTL